MPSFGFFRRYADLEVDYAIRSRTSDINRFFTSDISEELAFIRRWPRSTRRQRPDEKLQLNLTHSR